MNCRTILAAVAVLALVAVSARAQQSAGQSAVVTDGNAGPSAVYSDKHPPTVINNGPGGVGTGEVVGKYGVYGYTPAPTLTPTSTPTNTPTNTPTPTATATLTPTNTP